MIKLSIHELNPWPRPS